MLPVEQIMETGLCTLLPWIVPFNTLALESCRSNSTFWLLVVTVEKAMQALIERMVCFGPHDMDTRLQRRARERSREKPEHRTRASLAAVFGCGGGVVVETLALCLDT